MATSAASRRLARRFGLIIVGPAHLTIRRERRGKGFCYRLPEGTLLCDAALVARLRSLAVPPAYRNVRFSADPAAHLQAVGEDEAGRVQYRYHPDWTKVREAMKARRLAALAQSLPLLMRRVRRMLRQSEADRNFAVAAMVELVALTSIRAGGERYAQEHGTRGASTLLKSHVRVEGGRITLRFTGKGGKKIEKQTLAPRLAAALERLKALPGRRLFQYRDAAGTVKAVRAAEVNAFLKTVSPHPISLKDFRTLTASLGALDTLVDLVPEASARARRSQIKLALEPLAQQLTNTLTVCRSSYVHGTILAAFEDGTLSAFADGGPQRRSTAAKAELLGRLLNA